MEFKGLYDKNKKLYRLDNYPASVSSIEGVGASITKSIDPPFLTGGGMTIQPRLFHGQRV